MRGIKKKTLMLSVIASLFVAVLAIGPAFATTTILDAPQIEREDLGPGSSFSIDITVADVSAMWGYDFFLSYDPGMLTATNFGFYDPFVTEFPSEINVAEGYVALARGMEMMEPYGFDTVDPAPIAWIEFTVNDDGWSALDLYNSVVSDVYADPIDHEVDDGFFINIPVSREVNLVRRRAFAEHADYYIGKDEDQYQTLYGKVMSIGNKPSEAKVVFDVYDEYGTLYDTLETDTVMLMPYTPSEKPTDLSADFLIENWMAGQAWRVEARCYYDSDGDGSLDALGTTTKTFSFDVYTWK